MSNQADTMESEASTVRIDSTSSSRVNSFKAEMAANRAAARDGLTLDSPKDENGATRRRVGHQRGHASQREEGAFDEAAWRREMEERFETPLGDAFWKKLERDMIVPPIYRHRLQLYDLGKMQSARKAREQEPGSLAHMRALATNEAIVREIEDEYHVPRGTLDRYPRLKVACIAKAEEKRKLQAKKKDAQPAGSNGESEHVSSSKATDPATANDELPNDQDIRYSRPIPSCAAEHFIWPPRAGTYQDDSFLQAPLIDGAEENGEKKDGHSPLVRWIIKDMEDRVAGRKREIGPIYEGMRQATERYNQFVIKEEIERREQQAKQQQIPAAPLLSNLAIADILKKTKPECSKAQEFIKRAEKGKGRVSVSQPHRPRSTRPLSPSQRLTEEMDSTTRVQLATLRLQRALSECPDDE